MITYQKFYIVVTLVAATIPIQAMGHDPEQRQIASQVLQIFTDYCAACHDSAAGKSKGGFGHVLDLYRLRNDKEVVQSGDPESSELFRLVESGDMPEKGKKLTPAEVGAVHRWILMGAPAGESDMNNSPMTDEGCNGGTDLNRFIVWIGRFHPAVAHFPIALLVTAAIAQLIRQVTGCDQLKETIRFCTALGALSAVVAALLGWADAGLWGSDGYVTAIHRWMGTATAAWAMATLLLSEYFCRHSAQSTKFFGAYHLVLYVGAVLVLATGFFGGSIIYGVDHYAW